MGNQQGAMPRERHKSGSQDLIAGSPIRGEFKIFTFKYAKIEQFFFRISISVPRTSFDCLELIASTTYFYYYSYFFPF